MTTKTKISLRAATQTLRPQAPVVQHTPHQVLALQASALAGLSTGLVVPAAPAKGSTGEALPDVFWVQAGPTLCAARCAVSCLLAPSVGDAVLLACVDQQWWITAVLTAARPEQALLRVPHAQQLTVQVPTLHIDVQSFELKAITVRAASTVVQLVAQSVTAMAQQLLTFSNHVSSICRTRTAQVDEMDCLSARHIDVKAEQTYTQHAGQMVVTANDTIRLDGDRILMG